MSVTLTPEHEAMVQERVASGRYRDAQEVIGDALRLLAERERIQRALLEVARRDVDMVTNTPELMDKIYREAEEMFLRGEEPDPDVCS